MRTAVSLRKKQMFIPLNSSFTGRQFDASLSAFGDAISTVIVIGMIVGLLAGMLPG